MNTKKQQVINALKSAKQTDEIHKLFENPLANECLNIHNLGFSDYYKCIKALHPEDFNPKTLKEMQSQLQKTYQHYKDNLETLKKIQPPLQKTYKHRKDTLEIVTNTKANMVILALTNPKLYKECLEKKQLEKDCLEFCKSQYEFTKMLVNIKKAYKDDNNKKIQDLYASKQDLVHSCLTYNYLTRKEYEFVNSVIPSTHKEILNETYRDDKTAITALLVRNCEVYQSPKDLYQNLDKLLQQNFNSKGVVEECFKEHLDIKYQRKYMNNALTYCSKTLPSNSAEILNKMRGLNPNVFEECLKKSDPTTKKIIARIENGTVKKRNDSSDHHGRC